MITFSFKRLNKASLVIYDRVGSRFIARAIAHRVDWTVLDTRAYRIPLHPTFMFALLISLLEIPSLARRNSVRVSLSLIYEYAWIRAVRPQVVVSFIDNSIKFNNLSRIYRRASFIGVQNGFRNDAIAPRAQMLRLPKFLCFGSQTIEVYKRNNAMISEFVIAGSLKSGLFEATMETTKLPQFDLCWISQYRPARFNKTMPGLRENTEKQIAFLNRYCRTAEKSLVVAGSCRDRRFAHEYAFMLRHFDPRPQLISPNDDLNFSSYKLVRRSKLSITTSSTMGFEALSAGDRVLFLNLTDNPYYDVPQPHSDSLWSLRGAHLTYEEISSRVDQILRMEKREWQDMIRDQASHFVRDPHSVPPPQEVFWREISSDLEK